MDRPHRLIFTLTAAVATSSLATSAAQAQTCTQAPPDVMVSAPFDDSTGAVGTDLEPFRLSASTFGGPVSVDGHAGRALSFDGVDDYVEVNGGTSEWHGSFTVSAWVRATTGPTVNVIMDNRNETTSMGIQLAIFQGRPLLQISDSTGWTNFIGSSGPSLVDGNWHQVTATAHKWNGEVRLFVDGAPISMIGGALRTGTFGTLSPLWVGRKHTVPGDPFTSYFQGEIDEVRVYRRLLADAEIQTTFASAPDLCKTAAASLASARAQWGARGFSSFGVKREDRWRGGESYWNEVSPLKIFGRRIGTVVRTTNLDTGEVYPAELTEDFMKPFFDRIESAITRRLGRIDVKYHPVHGFPEHLYLDRQFHSVDTQEDIMLTEFRVGAP